MIEPLLNLREVHFMRGDAFQNPRAWAPNTVRIREVLEQTAAQSRQDALFVFLGICLCVQVCLPLTSVGLYVFGSFSDCVRL
jgi:hypothetical protein